MSNSRYCERCTHLTEHRTKGCCSQLDIILQKERQTKQCVRCMSCLQNEYKNEGRGMNVVNKIQQIAKHYGIEKRY